MSVISPQINGTETAADQPTGSMRIQTDMPFDVADIADDKMNQTAVDSNQ